MQRCIQLAENGLGTTYPNPLVGCVIVCKDKIIGEGWHKKAGDSHAEVLAIASVSDQSLLLDATLYVNLEPCSHFGRTPPCADLIIKHKIPRVIIGSIDPHHVVSGNGVKKLEAAGVAVTVGVLEEECQILNRRFFTFQNKKRPYIILKWAASADGLVAPASKADTRPVWITNEYSRQLVHKWRSEEQAILVGTQTVIDDNPKLNVRQWSGNNPIRIVLDRNHRIPQAAHIFDNTVKTVIISEEKTSWEKENILSEAIDFDKNVLAQILALLYRLNIVSVIIEGGSKTLQGFIDENLWDEARVFSGCQVFRNGTKAPEFNGIPIRRIEIEKDQLIIFRNHD